MEMTFLCKKQLLNVLLNGERSIFNKRTMHTLNDAKIKTFASTGGCQANPGTCVDICYTSDARTSSNKRNNLFKQMECS